MVCQNVALVGVVICKGGMLEDLAHRRKLRQSNGGSTLATMRCLQERRGENRLPPLSKLSLAIKTDIEFAS